MTLTDLRLPYVIWNNGTNNNVVSNNAPNRPELTLYYWDNGFHMLPQTWIVPHGLNFQSFLHLWFLGLPNLEEKVPPLRLCENSI